MKVSDNIKLRIPKPSPEEVKKYLIKRSSLDKHYLVQQRVIDKIFAGYPKNDDLEDVLLKSCVLNDFYSTNILKIFNMAEHIVELGIDNRLESYDPKLVNEIAKVEVNGKTRNFYSFATKYCFHHNSADYPIYDSYVHKVLVFFYQQDNSFDSKLLDFKIYDNFRNALLEFRDFYKLQQFNLLELDIYLWQLGKEYFPKNFGKRKTLDPIDRKPYNKGKEKQA